MEVEEIEERFQSSSGSPSSPSSLFSIPPEEDPRLLSQLGGVLREGTATPSESQGGRGSDPDPQKNSEGGGGGEGSKVATKEGQEGDESKGETPENQDVNSEPADSSGEEESGEDDHTLMENLSAKLEEAGPPSAPKAKSGVEGGGGEADQNSFLSALRKRLLGCLVERVGLVEEVGGMRAVCYLQVRRWDKSIR